jgi:hypothetical protein
MTFVSFEEPWWEEVVSAAGAERADAGRSGEELQVLAEVAEILAGTLARITLGGSPTLTTVTATLHASGARRDGALTARPAGAPTFRGEGPTRELEIRIELLDVGDGLVGDVHFAWAAAGVDA